MPRVLIELTEQFSDQRSNEIAYKLAIENQGTNAIEILSINPRIPEGVNLVEVKDISQIAIRSKHHRLCMELTELLGDHVLLRSEEIGRKLAKAYAEYFREAMGNPLGILLGRQLAQSVERVRRRSNALFIKIENSADAASAMDRFLKQQDIDPKLTQVFQTKMEKLAEIERELEKDAKPTSLATIEPDSIFSITYILKCPRSSLNRKKYNISVETTYSELGSDSKHVTGTSTSLIITPRPFILSLIAVVSSTLGILLRTAVSSQAIVPSGYYNEAYNALLGPQCIAAAILALVFFNIYEFTDLGKKFSFGVDWRAALLIGILCGIAGDRILLALKAFIGS